MKRETRVLFEKSLDSLVLSIEHFNRPWDRGREEVVLILLDRSFELLLKAVIIHRGGKIREPRANGSWLGVPGMPHELPQGGAPVPMSRLSQAQ